MRRTRRCAVTLLALLSGLSALPDRLAAQDDAVAAYHRAVADHFGVPTSEIQILAQSGLQPEEVPVALFLARQAGVSADALVALKRGGRGWGDLARRYDLGPGVFHVPVEGPVGQGVLAQTYESFRTTPTAEWRGLRLSDEEVIHLVNLRILSEYLAVPPRRVLDARERAGSYIAAYGALVRGRG
jgi:hypothetical protein